VQRFTSIAALTAFMLTAAACGDSSTTTPAASTTSAVANTEVLVTDPATTEAASTVPADAPKAIISLSPTGTEMLFAIGAGDQVIAVDDQSNYPAEALTKPHTLSGFEPSVEAIAKLKPDLVVVSDTKAKDQLESLGIKVWVGAAATTFDDVYTQIEQLGATTGHIGAAAELVSKMQTEIKAAVDSAPKPAAPLTVYHELDNTFYSVTSSTFIGQVYGLFGLKNIADGAQPGNDYPQLNAEYIVTANPDIIVLADTKCCAQSLATVGARPGWSVIKAVKNAEVVAMDDDIASRWGPRLVDYVQAVAAAVAKVPAGA
jgi:iron complex transport system substrate-binding protein